MANIVWPLELPQRPQRSPWQKQQPSSRWTFQGDEGPAMTRPKGESGQKMSMEFVMRHEQWLTFLNFWKVGINGGVLPFDYRDPDSGDLLEVRFDPSSETDFTVKAKGATHRTVTMTWEVLP